MVVSRDDVTNLARPRNSQILVFNQLRPHVDPDGRQDFILYLCDATVTGAWLKMEFPSSFGKGPPKTVSRSA
jgi:hypothetical protein